MKRFKESLKDAVRQMAYRTSVDSLKKRGVQQVNVLGMDRIVSLVEAAVHKSLKSRLVGMEREAVADATKAEFVRLMRNNEDLQREKSEIEQQKERAQEEVDIMRREIAQQEQALKTRLDEGALEVASRYEGENAVIAQKVADVMRSLQSQGGLAGAETKVIELVMDIVQDERKEAEEARAALRDREVENLRRRITKLNDSLAQTEHRLQSVSAMKNIDDGISSIYREVQGLDASDQQAGKKKELMSEIFRANLELQQKVKSRQ